MGVPVYILKKVRNDRGLIKKTRLKFSLHAYVIEMFIKNVSISQFSTIAWRIFIRKSKT